MKGEWTPIEERLPKIGKTVLVAAMRKSPADENPKIFVDIGKFEGKTDPFDDAPMGAIVWATATDWIVDDETEIHIVAWTPLPDLTPVLDLLGLGGDES